MNRYQATRPNKLPRAHKKRQPLATLLQQKQVALFLAAFLFSSFIHATANAQGTYLTQDALIEQVFAGEQPQLKTLWLTKEQKEQIKIVTGTHSVASRVRYQALKGKRLWILNEIGKERPITFGLVTQDEALIRIEVMVFRETRGDEIRSANYVKQYQGQKLNQNHQFTLPIDGISGATYSVNSMKKVAKKALLLNRFIDTAP